jgi:hypothetical protein
MTAIMERWIQTCRRELLDRMLIWNQSHLLHALQQYEWHYNQLRPHRSLANARPLRPLPEPIARSAKIMHLAVHRRTDSAASSTNTNMLYDLNRRGSRHPDDTRQPRPTRSVPWPLWQELSPPGGPGLRPGLGMGPGSARRGAPGSSIAPPPPTRTVGRQTAPPGSRSFVQWGAPP